MIIFPVTLSRSVLLRFRFTRPLFAAIEWQKGRVLWSDQSASLVASFWSQTNAINSPWLSRVRPIDFISAPDAGLSASRKVSDTVLCGNNGAWGDRFCQRSSGRAVEPQSSIVSPATGGREAKNALMTAKTIARRRRRTGR